MTVSTDLVSAVAGRPSQGRSGTRTRWLLTPALVVLAVMFVYPIGLMIWRSVAEPHLGPQNYEWFFTSRVALDVLQRTFVTALVVTAVTLVLSYPYAYLMTLVGPRGRALLALLVLLPFWTSLMVRTFAWVVLLQDSGLVNDVLRATGIGPVQLIRTPTGVMIGMAQVLMPFMVLPLFAVMNGVDRRLLSAAQSLGAHPLVAYLRVYVPLSLPGITAGSLTVFITALGFYVTPTLLGSPDDALISQQIFTQINGLLAWGRGGAMAVVLLVITLLLLGSAALTMRGSRRRGGGTR